MQTRLFPLFATLTWAGALVAQGQDGVGRNPAAPRPNPAMVRDESASTTARESLELGNSVALDVGITPIHTQEPDPIGGDYGIWAAGSKYKVGFRGDMTFVPYLGSKYPHNQPLSWHTVSVRVGDSELLGNGEQPVRQQDSLRYRYSFGQFTETYDVRADGLEQSFVLAQRPAGNGDLVIEGRLDTALRGEQIAAAHQAVRFFDDEGRMILSYGEAFAVDAAGRKTTASTTLDGMVLRLRVDARWLAEAVYPVTVDPLVTPTNIDFGTLRESVDICRDDSANQRLYTFIRTASATDKDVYAYLLADDYSTNSQVFNDITTSWSHDQIRCATAGSPLKYCAVFDRLFTGNTSAIRYHIHASADATLSTTVDFLGTTANIQDWRADVGGTLLGVGSNMFMVAYQRDAGATLVNSNNSEIWARTIDVSTTTPVGGTPFQLARWGIDPDQDMERPAINKQASATSPTVWMVVWQEYWNSRPTPPDDWDTVGRLVDSSGSASTAAWATTNETLQTNHQLGPVVAGAGGRYCVGYAFGDIGLINFKTGLVNGTAVVTERVDWSSLAGSPTHFQEHILWGPHTDRRWRVSDIAYDSNTDSHWAISSVSDRAYVAAATGSVYIDRVGYNGAQLETATLYGPPAGFSGDPGGLVFDDDHDEVAVVWAQNDLAAASTTAGTAHEVYANSFSYPTPTPMSLSGIGCSTATISWFGHNGQQIGHEFCGIQITGAPAGALHFVAVSFGIQNVPVLNAAVWPGCYLLVQVTGGNFLAYMPLAIGANVQEPLPLPEFLGLYTVYFQDIILDPTSGYFFSTQRLTLPIIK